MTDVQYLVCFYRIGQTQTKQDFRDSKQKGLHYFHNYLSFSCALMDILHDSHELDQDQRLDGTSPEKGMVMIWVFGGHMDSPDHFGS